MRRILFVSAPFGPFFRDLARALEARGCEVWRLCFEAGDYFETPAKSRVVFKGKDAAFGEFVEAQIHSKGIDNIVTFNDVLPRNRIALAAAARLDVSRYVIENGYLRPHWVTFEREGVNGYSRLPSAPDFYLGNRYLDPAKEADSFAHRMRDHVRNTIWHFTVAVACYPFMPFRMDYYGDPVLSQMCGYVAEYFWRKTHTEDHLVRRIKQAKEVEGRPIFTALMQKPMDGQLVVHSAYQHNNTFIERVVSSFAAHAPKNALLILKQHPFDYGVENSPRFAQELVERLGLSDRVIYLRMTSMDICIQQSDGLVTVNSTGGLFAVQQGLAVKCLGAAVYDMDGLTYQGSVDQFWTEAERPEPMMVSAFVSYLVHTSQLNGGFHTRAARDILIPHLADALIQDAVFPHHQPDGVDVEDVAHTKAVEQTKWAVAAE